MSCPSCAATVTTALSRYTALAYRMFRCRACRRTCNEHTGTPFNHLQMPTDVAVLVVLCCLEYKPILRNMYCFYCIITPPSRDPGDGGALRLRRLTFISNHQLATLGVDNSPLLSACPIVSQVVLSPMVGRVDRSDQERTTG